MKKQIIFLVMLFMTTALAFAEIEEDAFCIILVSGVSGSELSEEVTANIRSFTDSGRLRFRVRNRLEDDDIEILSVEVFGKNARGEEIKRSFSAREIVMEAGYNGIIPHRSGQLAIEIRRLTLFRSISGIIIHTDFIR